MDNLALSIIDEIEPAEVTRPLTADDIKSLGEVRGEQKPIPLTRRLSMRHHNLAKCIAQGMTDFEAVAHTGYDRAYVSTLKSDPTFKELVLFYKVKKDEEYVDFHKRLATLGVDVVDELHTRLETQPEDFSNGQLLEMTKVMADRTGFGPSSTSNVKVQVDMGKTLRAARERITRLAADRLVEDVEMKDITPQVADER